MSPPVLVWLRLLLSWYRVNLGFAFPLLPKEGDFGGKIYPVGVKFAAASENMLLYRYLGGEEANLLPKNPLSRSLLDSKSVIGTNVDKLWLKLGHHQRYPGKEPQVN